MSSAKHDLTHVSFEGRSSQKPPCHHIAPPELAVGAFADGREADMLRAADILPAGILPEEPLDAFVAWILGRAGLDAAAYRTESLHRRLPACLRTLKVHTTDDARALIERKPELRATAVSSLLIGVTEFFREPALFEALRTAILPALAAEKDRLRIWSAACSTGAELHSIAILLAELDLLKRSVLLGTDCRIDAIEQAKGGLFDAPMLRRVPATMRDRYFESTGRHWRPIRALRYKIQWKVADLLAGVEEGPWDLLLWRNSAIYLKPPVAAAVWHKLAAQLGPKGVLISGRAERPPTDAGLTHAGRNIYHAILTPASFYATPAGPSSAARPGDDSAALRKSR